MTNTPTLYTERLCLRKFTLADIDSLQMILQDKEVNKFLPWYPVKNRKETELFFQERYQKVYDQTQGYAYAVCLKKRDLPIGYIKVDMGDALDFGYGLRKEYWNQGIITEAGLALVNQVKQDGLPYITATHDRNNPASGRVMQKIGMHYFYSYVEQWQPKNIQVTFRLYQLNFTTPAEFVYRKYWEQYPEHFVETVN